MEEVTTLPDSLPTPESNQENAKPKAKGRGRGKAATSAPSKANSKPIKKAVGKKKAAPKKTGRKRAPLTDQSHNQNPEDTEEVDEFDGEPRVKNSAEQSVASADELVAVKQPAKKARTAAKGKTQPRKKQTDSEMLQQIKDTPKDDEFQYTPVTARQTKPLQNNRGRRPADKAKAVHESEVLEKVIPDTQEIAMDIEAAQPPEQSEAEEEIPQSVFRRANNAQSNSRPLQPAAGRRQVDYQPSDERGVEDSVLRRKLNEMTKKFESLEMKYKTLTEVGVKEAEANFDKLRMSAEAKSKGLRKIVFSYSYTWLIKAQRRTS